MRHPTHIPTESPAFCSHSRQYLSLSSSLVVLFGPPASASASSSAAAATLYRNVEDNMPDSRTVCAWIFVRRPAFLQKTPFWTPSLMRMNCPNDQLFNVDVSKGDHIIHYGLYYSHSMANVFSYMHVCMGWNEGSRVPGKDIIKIIVITSRRDSHWIRFHLKSIIHYLQNGSTVLL